MIVDDALVTKGTEVFMSSRFEFIEPSGPNATDLSEILASKAAAGPAEASDQVSAPDTLRTEAMPSGGTRVFSGCGFWSE